LSYIGNIPAEAYSAFQKQDFTTSATTSYTLDHAVANQNELALFINFVRQEPTAAYTASGTSLTLTSATSVGDDMYCVYLGKAVQTVNPPSGSVGSSQISADLITGQTAETSIATDDLILLSDTSASGALKKMTRANFVSGIGGNNTAFFYGELASHQTITRDTMTKITGMTDDEVDSDTAFDGTTFTVPSGKGGKYYLFSSVLWDFEVAGDDGFEAEAFIYKNGSAIKGSRFRNNTTKDLRYLTLHSSGIFDLSSGNTIELYSQSLDANGGNARVLNSHTSIGGYKLIE